MPRDLHGVAALAVLTSLGTSLGIGGVPQQGPDAALHHPVLVPAAVARSGDSTGDVAGGRRAQATLPGVSPEEFGAVPNDGHNDGRALQRAIDVAAHRGVPVRLAANATYQSRHWLRLVNGSSLIGAGSTSVIRFHWRKNDDQSDGYYVGNRDQMHGNHRITIARLHLEGAGTGRPVGLSAGNRLPNVPAIRMRLVHGLRIHHVEISRAPGISMLLQGDRGVRIRDNFVHNSGRDGINIGWFKRDSRRVLVEGNVIRRVGDDGIAIIGAPPTHHEPSGVQYRIVHNKILGWANDPNGEQLGRGISVLGARRVLIRHVRIRRPDSAGILIAPSSRPDRWNHHALWRSKRVRVVHNNIGRINTTGLLIKDAVRIRWHSNTFVELRRDIGVYTCRKCRAG
jgi:hypothetical protein